MQTIYLIDKPYLKGSLLHPHHSNNQFGWFFLEVVNDAGVFLVNCVLMTGGLGEVAPLVIIEVGIEDNIFGVNDDLRGSLAIHCIFEVDLLAKLNLSLYFVILYFVINDVVLDVLVFEVELEAATLALIFCLDLNATSLVKGTALYVAKIFFLSISGNLNVFVSFSELHFDLRLNCEAELFLGHASKVNVVKYVNLIGLNVPYFYLQKQTFVLNFFQKDLEVDLFVS